MHITNEKIVVSIGVVCKNIHTLTYYTFLDQLKWRAMISKNVYLLFEDIIRPIRLY